jgi:hypothetical protein
VGEDADALWHLQVLQAAHDYATARVRAAVVLQAGSDQAKIEAVRALIALAKKPEIAAVLHAPDATIVPECEELLKSMEAQR